MKQAHWKHFPHGADVGVCGIGGSKRAAFEQAALALTAAITDPHAVVPNEMVEVTCEAPDDELLFVDWLNALVYEMATRQMLFSRFEVHLKSGRLHGRAWGEAIDIARHQPAVEVKGATYTELLVTQDKTGTWRAQCVVDV
jgi:tRNA nucleotidyltransferase (CCA-adding enzyme)